MMSLESQVTSLDLSKRLKELGVDELRPIRGYESFYSVSNNGIIVSFARKCGYGSRKEDRIHGQNIRKGYSTVSLSKKAKQKTLRVHRLVAQAFLANPQEYPDVNHIDGDKLNNDVSNLEWCDDHMNQTHAVRIGLRKSERTNTAKLTVENVREIRSLYPTLNSRELAEKFGVQQAQICKILRRQSWKLI